jgi:serralysin
VISGGYGADQLSGGATDQQAQLVGDGQDVFVYLRVDSSLPAKSLRDVITDFDPTDRIDLSAIDANARRTGQQDFRWIGQRPFTGSAGQLRIDLSPRNYAFLQGDIDGNGRTDFEVMLLGVASFSGSKLLL